jgi:hypothetical protein
MKEESSRPVLAIGFFSSVLVAILAISSGSLWIDEFGTWLLTRADSIPDWWRRFQSWPDSGLMSRRGQLRDDPVAFALEDPMSLLLLGALLGLTFAAALISPGGL